MSLAQLPRLRLAHLPTPLDDVPHLSEILQHHVLIKRDDQTGLATGGNKARKLEFLLGAAQAANATVVLTTAGVHSNYLRMMAAGARKAGIRPILFMRGTTPETMQGNVLIDEIVGAELRFIDIDDPWSPQAREIMETAAEELKSQGEIPYVITVQTVHAPLASVGYVLGAFELYQQLLDRQIDARFLFVPSSSGVTHAGLLLGAKLLHWPIQIIGVSPAPLTVDTHRQRIVDIVERAAHLLDVNISVSLDDVIVEGGYAGAAYGVPTDGAIEAIRVTGESEGLLLDPVYSGKAMHALFDWARQGHLRGDGAAIFLHTGGVPNLFRQADTIGSALRQVRAR